MPNKTIYVRDERLWARARKLAGDDRLSSVVHELLTDWVRNKEAEMAGEMTEVELEVGGEMHAIQHGDDVEQIAFTGRLLADSDDWAIALPRLRVYQTHTGKLIEYRSSEHMLSSEESGATYRDYPDYEALTRDPLALNTTWLEGAREVDDDAHLTKGLSADLMKALGKPVVVRLD